MPHHHVGNEKLSPEATEYLRRIVATRGLDPASRYIGAAESTIDRLLGPGARKTTRDRLEARLRELMAREARSA